MLVPSQGQEELDFAVPVAPTGSLGPRGPGTARDCSHSCCLSICAWMLEEALAEQTTSSLAQSSAGRKCILRHKHPALLRSLAPPSMFLTHFKSLLTQFLS